MKYYEDSKNKNLIYKVSRIGKSSCYWVTFYLNGVKKGKAQRKTKEEMERSGVLNFKEVSSEKPEVQVEPSFYVLDKPKPIDQKIKEKEQSVQEFFFNGVKVRGMVIDNTPWFVGKDICSLFGDKNHNRSIGRVDEMDKRCEEIRDSIGRRQKAMFVNESGLYALLFAMQPQKAHHDGVSDEYPIEIQNRIDKLHRFKRWVTSEVLPSLRRTGSYNIQQPKWNVPQTFSEALKLASELQEQVEIKEAQLIEQKPRVEFCDDVLTSETLVTITDVAKDYGMTGIQLNRLLCEKKVQYKKRTRDKTEPYKLYAKYAKMGLARTITAPIYRNGVVIGANHILKWTEKGRKFIYELLKEDEIYPIDKALIPANNNHK